MNGPLQFQVELQGAGGRLDDFLALRLGGLSRMYLRNLILRGACVVNSRPSRPGYHVERGDLVEVTLEEGVRTAMDPEPIPLEVVHEDEQVLVVVKPAGMLVHPTRGVKSGTLANALAYHLNRAAIDRRPAGVHAQLNEAGAVVRPGIVHRLDRAASGLMIVARTQRALSILSRHFHHRRVAKLYTALILGRVTEAELRISAPIGRDPESDPKWGVMEGGKPAETLLRVLESRVDKTLVELEPLTGRTNQLRIHCAHIGHPIIGDEWYDRPCACRLCLHASRLSFNHPTTGDWCVFTSAAPAEILETLRRGDDRFRRAGLFA